MPCSADPVVAAPLSGVDPLPDWLRRAAARAPLYTRLPERDWPVFAHDAEDLADVASTERDPFGGRRDPARTPAVHVQVAEDLSVYWALDVGDLSRISRVLASSWGDLGVVSGERVGLFDYASSPMVAYASRSFMAHLDHGAADLLSCLPICSDGLPELAERCAHILEYVRPSTIFVDVDLVDPLLRSLPSSTPRPRRMVVTGDEQLASRGQIEVWQEALGADVRQMLRCDAALFFAPPCPSEPHTFHPSPAYVVEVVNSQNEQGSSTGRICVTNLSLQTSVVIRFVTTFFGAVRTGQCRCGREGVSVVIADE